MKEKSITGVLALVMLLGLISAISKPLEAMGGSANQVQFVTKEELMSNYNLNSGILARIKFGSEDRTWLIAGQDGENTLALLSTQTFATSIYGSTSIYADSTVQGLLKDYASNTAYFSEGEKGYMKSIEVTTLDAQGVSHEDAGILYLPDAIDGRSGWGNKVICVGLTNNVEIPLENLTEDKGFESGCFWLRSPREDRGSYALLAFPNGTVGCMLVGDAFGVLPVFNLDLSTVSFASNANAASKSTIAEDNSLSTNEAITLRYDAGTALGSAILSEDGKSIILKNISQNTYLIIQNNQDVNAYQLSESTEKVVINAEDITLDSQNLTSFDNCRVWVEATDEDRITTAKLVMKKSEMPKADYGIFIAIFIIVVAIFGTGAVCLNKRK